jgi:hypothetical protein
MMTILALLFIFAPMLRRKEEQKNKIEREYFDLLSQYRKNTSEEKLEELVSLGVQLFKNKDRSVVREIVTEDLKKLGV